MKNVLILSLFLISCVDDPKPDPTKMLAEETEIKYISREVPSDPPKTKHDETLPKETCSVTICNKIHRFSLDITKHIKDKFGETCFEMIIPKDEAINNKVLDSESRWYQGRGINPTKKSVTKIKSVNKGN